MFDSYLSESIIARAIKERKINVNLINPRSYAGNKHKTVDDRPYGGGPGMVMQAEPILRAFKKIKQKIDRRKTASKVKVIIFSPNGKIFTNEYADKLLKNYTDVVFISGRYEGIDARVKKALRAEEVTIGPYVLTGGELPAMVAIDVIARRVPGVLGCGESVEERRVSSSEVYTRPEVFEYEGKKYKVPKVLLSGDHKKIEEWKRKSNLKSQK